jgi:hypothetical protein
MAITIITDADVDPQECPACVAASEICDYHRGVADGRDGLAHDVGLIAELDRLAS